MTGIKANKIQIEYETFGDETHPPVLLIIGLGAQMIHWHEDFCAKLASHGYYVIRFDNRNSGLSTKTDGYSMEDITQLTTQIFSGQTPDVPVSIEDMADDALGLMDALNIKKAHICGMSMGGFIAQTFCIKNPSRALSLTSIYSATGARGNGSPGREIIEAMLTPAPIERQANIEYRMDFLKLTYGHGLDFDEIFHRDLAERAFDRSFTPKGTGLQYLAILTQKDRTHDLEELSLPTLIVHGDDDPLIPMSGGEATAKAIKNSKLKILKGMGHIMPNLNAYWDEILDEMVLHFKQQSE